MGHADLKYNRGYKPGGLGARRVLHAGVTRYRQELVDAFELGFKRNGRLDFVTNATRSYDYQGWVSKTPD
jgi:hypothetical protein